MDRQWTDTLLGFQAQKATFGWGHWPFSDKAASNLFQGFFCFFFLIKHKDHGEGRAPQLYSTFTWTAASCHWWKYENSPVFANSVMTMALGNPGDTRYQLLTLRRVHCYIKMLKLMELEEHSALIPILRWRKLSPRNGNLSHKQLDDKPVRLSRQGSSPSTSNSKRPSAS